MVSLSVNLYFAVAPYVGVKFDFHPWSYMLF